jgi:acyl dehydratase
VGEVRHPNAGAPRELTAGGPFFEDLAVGDVFAGAPAVTLDAGRAALHGAITGNRLRVALDATLAARVAGPGPPLAHPALVWDVAIGHSTLATRRVIANLFYRGLVLRRAPRIGDTLHTTTEVVALRQTTRRPDRPPRGLAVLRVVTVDQDDRPVLDFWRCPMLPLRDPGTETGHADDVERFSVGLDDEALAQSVTGWDLAAFRAAAPGEHAADLAAGTAWTIEGGDVVSCAPELARLTLNVAIAHHDRGATRDGRRLVYGGHTIALAAGQAARALPNLVTIVGWHSCDHTGPVYEGDTLHSRLELERVRPLRDGALVHLRSTVRADRGDGTADPVLDWRFVAAMA